MLRQLHQLLYICYIHTLCGNDTRLIPQTQKVGSSTKRQNHTCALLCACPVSDTTAPWWLTKRESHQACAKECVSWDVTQRRGVGGFSQGPDCGGGFVPQCHTGTNSTRVVNGPHQCQNGLLGNKGSTKTQENGSFWRDCLPSQTQRDVR